MIQLPRRILDCFYILIFSRNSAPRANLPLLQYLSVIEQDPLG